MLIPHLGASRIYAIWNAADKGAGITLSGGQLVASDTAGSFNTVRATVSRSTGKWYWEVEHTTVTGDNARAGLANVSASLTDFPGNSVNGWDIGQLGAAYHGGSSTATGVSYASGDKIGIAWDAGAGKLWFAKNNVWLNSGDPAGGTSPIYTSVTGTLYPCCSLFNSAFMTLIPGPSLTYSPPTGFSRGFYSGA